MRLLTKHLNNVAEALKSQSRVAGVASHGDNIGAAREALARLFLEAHLPRTVSYFTGELFDQVDNRSGQIDLIVHPASSPLLHIADDVKLISADSALALIEVKSSLTTASFSRPSHLRSALDSCVRIKHMRRDAVTRGTKLHGEVSLKGVPYLIFAFDGPKEATLRAHLHEYQSQNSLQLWEMPDLVTVLSGNYYLVQNNGWIVPPMPLDKVQWSSNRNPEEVLIGIFAYLTHVVEAYATLPRFFPFHKYLGQL